MVRDAVCIIPARGSSKRVPRKNIRRLGGKPLIAHSIAAALDSGCFERIVVSTDDAEIAAVAREAGAEVPFMRPAELADDFATTASVVLDALERIGSDRFVLACCLYPTAPLIRGADLAGARARLLDSGADTVVAVTEFDYPPARALTVADDGRLAFQWPEHAVARSQDVPHLIHDAGMFYWLRTGPFIASGTIIGDNAVGHPIDRLQCIDIDTEQDFAFAEQLFALHMTAAGNA